jgi:signal transduction histidine kinase
MNLSFVEEELEALMRLAAVVKDSRELVRENVASIRNLSYLLHPPLLDENGLASALPWYTEGLAKRSNIKVDLELPEDLGRLSRDSEVAIFRIVQECLTNVMRHSESTIAKIRITQTGSEVCVVVEDSGKGISPEKLLELTSEGTPGVGLRGMRERIRQLGGTLEISSEGSGRGTVVTARMPRVGSQTPTVPIFPPLDSSMPQNDPLTH